MQSEVKESVDLWPRYGPSVRQWQRLEEQSNSTHVICAHVVGALDVVDGEVVFL